MKNPLVRMTAAVAVGLSPLLAAAQAPAPEHTLTGNMTLTSDYRFRGISQSFRLPAIQGGIDYGHASGFYLGNWNSSVSGNQYPNGASLEMDFYGGYKWEVSPGIVLDFGTIYYYYPGASYPGLPDSKYDHWEIYAGVGAGPFGRLLAAAELGRRHHLNRFRDLLRGLHAGDPRAHLLQAGHGRLPSEAQS